MGDAPCAFSPICWDREGNCIDNTIFLAGELETGIFYADFDLEELRAYRAREMLGIPFESACIRSIAERSGEAALYPPARAAARDRAE